VAQGLCQAGQFSMPGVAQARLERWLAPARKQLGSAAAQVTAEGERLSLSEAVSYALADEPEDTWRSGPRRTLTPRELEVASLVARGLTNRSIAGRLHLSVRTVDTHVDHVLTKLGFSNRSQLVAWAYESGLAPDQPHPRELRREPADPSRPQARRSPARPAGTRPRGHPRWAGDQAPRPAAPRERG
jgi:DNA-binding CsgD family transcriptional regulator